MTSLELLEELLKINQLLEVEENDDLKINKNKSLVTCKICL